MGLMVFLQAKSNLPQTGADIFGLLFWPVIIVGGIIWWKWIKKSKRDAEFNALPKEGPMKVEITEEDYPASTFNSKRYKCSLCANIQLSQADWQAVHDMGLMKHTLFESPAPSGEINDPDNVWRWTMENVRHNRGRIEAGFRDVIQMQEAKERLLTSLQALRSHIEDRQHGPKKESIEI